MTRTLICLAILGFLLLAPGCGGSSGDDLGRAAGKVVGGSDDVPVPKPPPTPPAKPRPSPAQLDSEAFLESEEAENVACFLFTKAANGELSADFGRLEAQVLEYFSERFYETVAPQYAFATEVADFAAYIDALRSGSAELDLLSAIEQVC